jgi:prevent-host-death family protein
MITVNMHEAKTRLSELVKAVEENGEIVILCRHGKEVAEIRPRTQAAAKRFTRLKPHPELKVTFAPGYDPTEPLQPDELPDWMR